MPFSIVPLKLEVHPEGMWSGSLSESQTRGKELCEEMEKLQNPGNSYLQAKFLVLLAQPLIWRRGGREATFLTGRMTAGL